MDVLENILKGFLILILIWLSIPFFAAFLIGGWSKYRNYWDMMETFDFTADILYPWRWKDRPKRFQYWRGKGNKVIIMKQVTIYTDGACSGNPGPGGWGAILRYGPHEKEISGGEAHTTNNRMELMGVISALKLLKEPCEVELYSDSKYVIDALEKGWARGWQKRGWVKSDKKPALNPDLWEELLKLCDIHTVRTHWVKGHADNPYNNRCDELAVAEWQKRKG